MQGAEATVHQVLLMALNTVIIKQFMFKTRHKHITTGPPVRADFRRLYPANAKTPTCCPSDDNRTKVTNSVTSARSLGGTLARIFGPRI